MPVSPAVLQWVNANYPRPKVDLEWLEACCAWITTDLGLPATPTPASPAFSRLTKNIELQLLQSSLSDSLQPNTGIPPSVLDGSIQRSALGGRAACLVEVVALDEVGHSAFSLMNVRQARIDRADLAGLAREREGGEEGGEGQDEEDEGPVPRYPRSMLKLTLSDGTHEFKAMEYKRIPELKLEDTPLGYKIALLPTTQFRRGVAYLEPGTIVIKGYQTEDRDVHRDRVFLRGLRLRLGQPIADLDADIGQEEQQQPPQDPPPPPPPPSAAPAPCPTASVPRPTAPTSSAATTLVASPYFSGKPTPTASNAGPSKPPPVGPQRRVVPVDELPPPFPDDEDEETFWGTSLLGDGVPSSSTVGTSDPPPARNEEPDQNRTGPDGSGGAGSGRQNRSLTESDTFSGEFGDDSFSMMDDSFLAQIDIVEQQALSVDAHTQSTTGRLRGGAPSSSIPTASSGTASSQALHSSQTRPKPLAAVIDDSIELLDGPPPPTQARRKEKKTKPLTQMAMDDSSVMVLDGPQPPGIRRQLGWNHDPSIDFEDCPRVPAHTLRDPNVGAGGDTDIEDEEVVYVKEEKKPVASQRRVKRRVAREAIPSSEGDFIDLSEA
ncbi:hypothetical protein PUNSTDRAFT_125847 [Punctularia strigosozonata HHB-11173 SS5]|uniref:uncharacterized protein n=1 Tax=Punctularia strigosozonata (strain HHB-11173) TaxID=741275 RepID=UPI0004417608|nr:uncharacterized protein PUNSTDRAFT_125847 [Punctularia strigosozonata HHB-11173 SS5]EIN09806.1 hypothetical protein PUNSTDRAFT_125847 [Punctularia strigosozonata HHB-11173 SS5]